MTKGCNICCANCPLSGINNTHDVMCETFERTYPEEYVSIVETWSKEHPVKTRQSELLKMFPNIPMKDGIIHMHPCAFGIIKFDGEECNSFKDCYECHTKCWLEEIE